MAQRRIAGELLLAYAVQMPALLPGEPWPAHKAAQPPVLRLNKLLGVLVCVSG